MVTRNFTVFADLWLESTGDTAKSEVRMLLMTCGRSRQDRPARGSDKRSRFDVLVPVITPEAEHAAGNRQGP